MIWCHTFADLGITGSQISVEDEQFILSAFPNLENKTVLDLATFDGFYAYEACKRGAKYVVAIDNGMGEEILGGPDKGKGSENMSYPNAEERQKAIWRQFEKIGMLQGRGFISFVPLNVEDMDRLIPDFDIIFCFGLYYHVTDLYGLFEKCFKKCRELLIVEGLVAHVNINDLPAVFAVNSTEVHNDPTTFWVPTEEAIRRILLRVGFSTVEVVGERQGRILMKAYKV